MLPEASFLIMYGPVATWCRPYVDCVWLSNFRAYDAGTGAVIGSPSAPTKTPDGCCNLKTRVVEFGVWMPRMLGIRCAGLFGAPTRSPKYAAAYPFATLVSNPRSIAYFTSADVTARLTG